MSKFSINGSDTWAQSGADGTIVNVAHAVNTTTAAKVFTSRSIYEDVPGTLKCSITPKSAKNMFIVRAHLYSGGWTTALDVAPLFRVYWGFDSSCPNTFGPLWGDAAYYANLNLPHGVNAGTYKYGKGDNNASSLPDLILTAGSIPFNTSTTSPVYFAIKWAAGYEANSRTLYWNRAINTSNAYNPIHTCTMTVSEVSAKGVV